MGFLKTLKEVVTAAVYRRGILQLLFLLAAALFLADREEALATLLPLSSAGTTPTPLGLRHMFRFGHTLLRTPVAVKSRNVDPLPSEHRLAPSFLSWWTSPVPEFTEASVAGEWEVRGRLQGGVHGGDSSLDGANAAADAVRRAAGPKEAALFQRVWEAFRSGRCLCLSLSTNRIAALSTPNKYSLRTSFSVAGIWQVRRRPFLPVVVEVELGFPADMPEVILVLQAPLKPGTWLKHVPQVGPAEASLSLSPFFPWKSHRLGVVEIKPQEKDPTVDTLLQ